MSRTRLLVLCALLWPAMAQAQFTADYQTNIISGVVSNWSGSYIVGSNTVFELLRIENGGVLSNGFAYIGYEVVATNNSVIVSGSGSRWNSGSLIVGLFGSGCQLTITNGARVESSGEGAVGAGYLFISSNNVVTVTGSNSVWSISETLKVGDVGAGNLLLISDGGTVYDSNGYLGDEPQAVGSNTVIVSGAGSVWSNRAYLSIGNNGSGDRIIITDGGALYDDIGHIGVNPKVSNGVVTVSGPGSVWKNFGNYLSVGFNSSGNRLVITNGGKVYARGAILSDAGGDANEAIVSGPGSVWSNTSHLYVGLSGSSNRLVVTDGGQVYNDGGRLNTSYNVVSVSGSGSVWQSQSDVAIGGSGSSNSLVISDGGIVLGGSGLVGGMDGPTFNNSALVTGSGSVWSNGDLNIGWRGMGNSLVVSNGGVVISRYGNLGVEAGDNSNNTVTVVGNGSLWQSSSGVWVWGSGNQLTIADGGSVVAASVYMFNVWPDPGNAIHVLGGSLIVTNGSMTIPQAGIGEVTISNGIVQAQDIILANCCTGTKGILTMTSGSVLVQSGMVVGYGGCATTGTVVLTGGTCSVTNAAHSAVLEVRSGTLTHIGGALLIDNLVITNACGRFIHTGGTLLVGNLVLDPNLDADGDGLPNGWEQSHGLDPLTPSAGDDPDGDGLPNAQEFALGTDPNDSSSPYRITGIAQEGADIRVTWQTVGGKTNFVQATSDLSMGFFDLSPAIAIAGVNVTTTNYLDIGVVTNSPSRFYRVRVVP